MKKTLSLLAIVLAAAATSFAGQVTSKAVVVSEDCRFRAQEWKIDASVVGAGGVYNGNNGLGLGGNLGVDYYFTRYFGIGVDNSVGAYKPNGPASGAQGTDSLQADLLVRYPICAWNLAFYGMIGGGANWGAGTQGDGNIGAGAEYRFTRNIGLFADCRWLYGGSSLSMALPRVGLSFAF